MTSDLSEGTPRSFSGVADPLESWEGEGGAVHGASGTMYVRKPPAAVVRRSHHFGEGQCGRTITQDEQDRLAAR
jgi:hypothetical protein